MNLFKGKRCQECNARLKTLGGDVSYYKLSYHYCGNEAGGCSLLHQVIIYKFGKYSSISRLKVMKHLSKRAEVYDHETDERYVEKYA